MSDERAGSGESELCGPTVHGFFCVLPKAHNMGNADVPDNHQAAASARCPSTSGGARCWYFAGHPGELHRDMENNISWGRYFTSVESDPTSSGADSVGGQSS